jgi:predicted nucleic acid-binding protein
MKVIILADTNILISFCFQKLIENDRSPHYFEKVIQKNTCYVSSFIVYELRKVITRDFWYTGNMRTIGEFLISENIKLHYSVCEDFENRSRYVHDHYDAQIVIDAVSIHADVILTKNLKHFAKEKILNTLKIKISNKIDDWI